MALHNSFKQGHSQQQDNRLASAPTTEDLGTALGQARTGGRRPVVMSWKSPKTNAVFWLSVTASGAGNEAEWLLQKGAEGAQPKNVWNHKTTDTTLIQSLLAAEEEMAFKSGNRTLVTPPPSNGQSLEQDPWDSAKSSPTSTSGNAPIVLGGGVPQPQRPEAAAQAPAPAQSPWQGGQAPGWNVPQPAGEPAGWGYLPPSTPPATLPGDKASPSTASNPNLFAGLKETAEEPKPLNPFNSLMSNQNLPQQQPQTKQIDLPEKPLQPSGHKFVDDLDEALEGGGGDLPTNSYDGLTNSGQGIKTVPGPQAVQPARPPALSSQLPRIHSSQTSSSTRIPIVSPGDGHSPQVHPPVPNFAAMTSSGAYPVVSLPPDQALNPKNTGRVATPANQARGGSSPQSGANNQQSPAMIAPPATPSQSPNTSQNQSTKQLPAPVDLDRAAVDDVFKSLSNPETGLLNHGSMLFFLVREFSRYQTSKEPFSLIIMEMSAFIESSTGQRMSKPLLPRAVRAATQKIFSLTRQLDLVCHYEQTDFAILLPTTNRQEAKEFAQSVVRLLMSQPLTPDMDKNALIIRMGLASFPEDTSHPGILLAAASDAKVEAIRSGKTLVLFSET